MNSDNFPENYKSIVELVPEVNVYQQMEESTKDLLKSLIMTSNSKAEQSYAPGKWNIKEVLQHLMDVERVFSYRALCIARGDRREHYRFDVESYAQLSHPNHRKLRDIMDEVRRLRISTIDLFKSFDDDALDRKGLINGEELSVKQLLIILIGHEMHHLRVLNEKYLS